MDRRNFLRMGSLAVLGSLAAPSLALPDTVRGALGGTDNKSAVAAAMNQPQEYAEKDRAEPGQRPFQLGCQLSR